METDMPDRSGTRDELLERQRELKERVEAIRRDFEAEPAGDPEDQAVQPGNRDGLNTLLDEALSELEKIEASLRRP
jgi:RNA polymerase-binding transcription factor DksA